MAGKYTLPGDTKFLGASGTNTYTPGESGREAYWLIVLGTTNATITVVSIGNNDNFTGLELVPGAAIPIRSKDVTVTAGQVLLVIEGE